MNIPNDILYNPTFWIFVSYTIGAWFTTIIINSRIKESFLGKNFLEDSWTKRIGVLHFGWLVKHSFMRVFNQKLKYKGKLNHERLSQLKHEMTLSEIGHLVAFYFLILINGLFIYLKLDWRYNLVFFILNIIFNFYLVLLQQYNKRRIEKLLKNKVLRGT